MTHNPQEYNRRALRLKELGPGDVDPPYELARFEEFPPNYNFANPIENGAHVAIYFWETTEYTNLTVGGEKIKTTIREIGETDPFRIKHYTTIGTVPQKVSFVVEPNKGYEYKVEVIEGDYTPPSANFIQINGGVNVDEKGVYFMGCILTT